MAIGSREHAVRFRLRSLMFITLLQLACAAVAQERGDVQQYTLDDGLPQNSIRSLAFDDHGYLWLTTEGGLVRFDGRHFKVYTMANDTTMVEDRMGHLFRSVEGDLLVTDVIGSLYRIGDHGPERLYDGRGSGEVPFKISGSIPAVASYRSIAFESTRDTNLQRWVRWDNQIFSFSTTRWASVGPEAIDIRNNDRSEMRVPVRSNDLMSFQWRGAVHVLALDGLLHRLDVSSGALSIVPMESGPDPRSVQRIFWSSTSSDVFALSDDILWRLQERSGDRLAFVPYITGLPQATPIISVTSMDGSVFIGTANKGLFRYRSRTMSTIRRPTGKDDALGNAFYAMVPMDSSSVLVQDGWTVDREGHFVQLPFLGVYAAEAFHRDDRGRLWTFRADTLRITDQRTGTVFLRSKITVGTPECYLQEGDTTWMAGSLGLAAFVNDRQVVFIPLHPSNYRDRPFALARAPDGHLWMATGHGVLSVDPLAHTVDTVSGLQGLLARALHRDGERLFIGTYGQGAFVATKGRVQRLALDPKDDLTHVHAFVPDPLGHFWIPTNRGLFSVHRSAIDHYLADTTALLHAAFHGSEEGVTTTEFNGGCSPVYAQLADGHVVLPTIDGLVWFRPSEIGDPWPKADLQVDAIRMNGRSIPIVGTLGPVAGDASLEILVSIPFFGNPGNLRMEYRLDGLEDVWATIPEDGRLRFERLPGGRFALKVKVVGGSADRIQELLTIEVVPPWYRRWWAIALLAFMLVGLGLSVQRWRYQRVVEREKELARVVDERTEQLRERNEVLQRDGEVKERLVRILSHDIVAPLKAIARVGRFAVNGEHPLTDTEVRAAITDMSAASAQLHDNASNLLNWIKHQGGRVQVRKQHVALHDFVDDVLMPLQGSAKHQAVTITNAVTDEMMVKTDPDLLAIILSNLVSNAVKHAPNAEVCVTASETTSGFVLEVADKGPGISATSLGRIYELLDGKGRDNDLRTGLGYMIIADMAGLLGATMSVTSTTGKGTCVRVAVS